MLRFERDDSPRHGHALATPGGRFSRPSGSRLVRFFNLLLEWQSRAVQRHHLAGLDDRMLKDIGLDRATIHREVRKPFWQA